MSPARRRGHKPLTIGWGVCSAPRHRTPPSDEASSGQPPAPKQSVNAAYPSAGHHSLSRAIASRAIGTTSASRSPSPGTTSASPGATA